ncbi:MAG: PotD/PotF family extracellular solute-binding protein, partial [Albidovulum sp.]|nr:PotD/PotF family extracellular solute-binding protein [Albidovulum sp.]
MRVSRRSFNAGFAGTLGLGALAGSKVLAERNDQLNILCWEGYNSDEVLGPFRRANPDATVRAESGTSDPDMINKLRAGEVNVWDLINVNQPWARAQLYPEGLILPLDKDRFLPFFDSMLSEFQGPYP